MKTYVKPEIDVIVLKPEEQIANPGSYKANNGWGNGDQTAPGNSGSNNNAENGSGNSNGNGNGNGNGKN